MTPAQRQAELARIWAYRDRHHLEMTADAVEKEEWNRAALVRQTGRVQPNYSLFSEAKRAGIWAPGRGPAPWWAWASPPDRPTLLRRALEPVLNRVAPRLHLIEAWDLLRARLYRWRWQVRRWAC